ncbi:hypothetical protein [Streptomyces sp. CNQ-509]|uniref:hypothetical protein n=1 Tax=Streptomyces sp. CNQ-509 TaxID=444103 RepID=UPI000ADA3B1F|nr:hypothetical protein [Streptomyces sp. CNQ-509]
MGDVVPYLAAGGCLLAVMGFLTWLKGVVRRRGLAGSAMRGALAAYEEAMRVTAHDSHHEVRAAAERQAPAGASGDPRRRLRFRRQTPAAACSSGPDSPRQWIDDAHATCAQIGLGTGAATATPRAPHPPHATGRGRR